MATDPFLLERMRRILQSKKTVWAEKKMFGGNCFMVDDKMLVGTFRGGIMARIAPEEADALMQRPGVDQMYMKDKPMVGYLMVDPIAYDADADLEFWMEKCLAFHPRAKSSKK
ncbi:MAG: TfoX/Sxy family protein [Lewinellaceae bacterium]|nr:TfoX/Sxy family protein [Lewinellaceae bacterium]